MRIIAVIDVLGGQVVAARAGNRTQYQPIQSPLCDSASPGEIARAFVEKCGVREFYLADLDGLQGSVANHDAWQAVAKTAESLWIDCGIRTPAGWTTREQELVALNIQKTTMILASESWAAALPSIARGRHAAFSIDLRDGSLVSPVTSRQSTDPVALAKQLIDAGWSRFVLLDVAAVGMAEGCPTINLCRAVRRLSNDIEIVTGGGVRNQDDLRRLEDAGCDAVLVSTALHAGHLRVS